MAKHRDTPLSPTPDPGPKPKYTSKDSVDYVNLNKRIDNTHKQINKEKNIDNIGRQLDLLGSQLDSIGENKYFKAKATISNSKGKTTQTLKTTRTLNK